MTKESLEKYCLTKRGAVKEYPFDKVTAVYKVGNKMFALSSDEGEELCINLKCDPHMSKKHWNTVVCNREADDKLLREWIDDSYDLVFSGLTKKLQHEINSKG